MAAKFRGAVLICGECGSEFKVPPSRADKAKYCSKECADKHRNPVTARVTLTCAHCGGEFVEHECHADRRRFCSRRCMHRDAGYRDRRSRQRMGEANPMWRGGVSGHADGYLYRRCPQHPFASNGYVFEHRVVMEAWLRENAPDSPFLVRLGENLYLSPDYVVHHKDENKRNNAVSNLECMTLGEHNKLHNSLRAERQRG